MLIIHAKIHTMEQENFLDGYIQIQNTKITAVGSMDALQPSLVQAETTVLDLHGMHVLPGLIDAHTHLGMWEDGLGFEGDDGNEETDPVTPHLRALDAVNPLDRCFSEALDAGITTVLTGPGSANPIGGSWVAMKTKGRRMEDMVLSSAIGMKFALGENPKTVYNGKNQTPNTRMATAALIRETLEKARRYQQDMARAAADEDFDAPEFDAKSEALLPVLQRKMKAFFHAHRADDLFTAIRISNEFDLDYVLVHTTEGYCISDELVQENAAVITGPLICDRAKPELRGHTAANPGILSKAGLHPAICTDHPVVPIQYLLLSAVIAYGEGLPYEETLRSITLYPAQIAGISQRVGSIAAGKDADLVIYAEYPLAGYVKPVAVLLNGEIVRGTL